MLRRAEDALAKMDRIATETHEYLPSYPPSSPGLCLFSRLATDERHKCYNRTKGDEEIKSILNERSPEHIFVGSGCGYPELTWLWRCRVERNETKTWPLEAILCGIYSVVGMVVMFHKEAY